MTTGRLDAEHGVVCRLPDDPYGYFGWPSVAKLHDGTLLVASSGLRTAHICPYGKTVIHRSEDGGATWSEPQVIVDSMIDDRDAGVTEFGDGKVIVTTFTSDTRRYDDGNKPWSSRVATWSDADVEQQLGSWAILSDDGGRTWDSPVRVALSSPHGPACLASGELLYLGKAREGMAADGAVRAARSADGRSWTMLGEVPLHPGTQPINYHEAHVVELPGGRLIGMIRIQNHSGVNLDRAGITQFSMMQTESDDGGQTWSQAHPLGFHGSPPHLVRHSSGVLVLTYGYRLAPYGQRVAFSKDDGATWQHDWVLRDDGPDGDLGYPATVELDDGRLLTVYYQKVDNDPLCSLLWSTWTLP